MGGFAEVGAYLRIVFTNSLSQNLPISDDGVEIGKRASEASWSLCRLCSILGHICISILQYGISLAALTAYALLLTKAAGVSGNVAGPVPGGFFAQDPTLFCWP